MSSRTARAAAALVAVLVVLAVSGHASAGGAAAACDYPILSLADVMQRAPNVVLASVIREQPDGAGGFNSVLRINGLIKGRALSPVITLDGLGHLATDCSGGPRLPRGSRVVLFLTHEGEGANTIWSVVDAEGGVYQLTPSGIRFPPLRAGDQPQQVALTPADFVRNVGIVAGADPARIDDMVTANGLSDMLERGSAVDVTHHTPFEHLPRRETSLAIAAAAVLIAALTFLFWRPAGRSFTGRP